MIEFREVAQSAISAAESSEPVALASVVRVRGSSPRHNGARMLIWPDGRIVGTIGGGTLEWRVMEHAQAALAENRSRLANYVFDTRGGPDSVGLCGGSVDVFIDVAVAEFAHISRAALAALEQGQAVVVAAVVRDGEKAPGAGTWMLIWPDGRTLGSLGALDSRVIADAQAALAEHGTGSVSYTLDGEAEPQRVTVHLDVLRPEPTLLIIGAGHVAQPLAAMGSQLGLRVCLVDDRAEWANRERFPTVNELAVIGYEPVNEILDPIPFPMNPATYVVVTTWGYDLPAMAQALQQNPAYIGLVASPTKARVLFKRLQEAGYSDEAIRRIQAPIGLDIGAESPAEIALCILAEILMISRGRTGRPLREVRGSRLDALFAQRLAPVGTADVKA